MSDPLDLSETIRRAHEVLDASPTTKDIPKAERERIIREALARYGKVGIVVPEAEDNETDIADEPTQTAGPVLSVPEAASEPYWYEDPADAAMMEHFILSRVALGARLPGGLLVTGPSGCGKTLGAIKAVERLNAAHPELGLPLLVMNCPTVTDPQKWFGRRELDKAGLRYEKSSFIETVEAGGVIVLDEFMRLHPTIHNPVMSLLDGTESVLLPDLGVTVSRHPRTVFIGTTNQGVAYGGTHRMDWAMRERWSFTIERSFPPREEEIRILTSHNPGCDEDAAAVLVDIATKTREMWAAGDLRTAISTRTLDNAAFLVASGMTERMALQFTALAEFDGNAEGSLTDETDRGKVMGVIEGRTGRRR